MAGWSRLTRTPRRPRKGLSSLRQRQVGQGLVAADVEGADDQGALATERLRRRRCRRAACSSSSGAVSRSSKRNSERSRPTPSAPLATAVARILRVAHVGDHFDALAVGSHRRRSLRRPIPRARLASPAGRRAAAPAAISASVGALRCRIRRDCRRARPACRLSSASAALRRCRTQPACRTSGRESRRGWSRHRWWCRSRAPGHGRETRCRTASVPRRSGSTLAGTTICAWVTPARSDEHAAADVADVVAAFAQQGIVEGFEAAGALPRTRRARQKPALLPWLTPAIARSVEVGVGEQFLVSVEDLRLGGVGQLTLEGFDLGTGASCKARRRACCARAPASQPVSATSIISRGGIAR
jgi:hypothetical protein